MRGDTVGIDGSLERTDVEVFIAGGLGSQHIRHRKQPVRFIIAVGHIVKVGDPPVCGLDVHSCPHRRIVILVEGLVTQQRVVPGDGTVKLVVCIGIGVALRPVVGPLGQGVVRRGRRCNPPIHRSNN